MLDVLFIAYNRFEMTREAFAALVANTNWENVSQLHVHDDNSSDGTQEWLGGQLEEFALAQPDVGVDFVVSRMGGPVAATNAYLERCWPRVLEGVVDRFAKCDNDFIVCPGWLDEILNQMTLRSDIDVFGIEPMIGPPVMPPYAERHMTLARHIGGKGIIRHRIFDYGIPRADGRQGWSQFQWGHRQFQKAWLTPDLPCFSLDQLPFEPWVSLTKEYQERGWGRATPWPNYDESSEQYWAWWKSVHMEG